MAPIPAKLLQHPLQLQKDKEKWYQKTQNKGHHQWEDFDLYSRRFAISKYIFISFPF